jgi:hypothetical protein
MYQTLKRVSRGIRSELWFRSSEVIGHPVGSLCFLLGLGTWFSLVFGTYCSDIVPTPVLFSSVVRVGVLILFSSLTAQTKSLELLALSLSRKVRFERQTFLGSGWMKS